MKNILKNWKTTVAGVVMATTVFLKAKEIIDGETMTLILSLSAAFGLIAAKDNDQTGIVK